jgi:hypothetical protein
MNNNLTKALKILNEGMQYLTSIETHLNDADETKIFSCCDCILRAMKIIKEEVK